ncbi:MAG: hypothetical protein HQM09_14690 [Candidatus Riflebacteria bacterium]|nr:hypothetical protein [Candidatus Riflebacteria bacterium]
MTNLLSEEEIDTLLNTSGNSKYKWVDYWQANSARRILVSPKVFSSPDFESYGWPLIFYWKQGFVSLVLTERLLLQYIEEMESNVKADPMLKTTWIFFLKKSIEEIETDFPLIEYGRLTDDSNLDFMNLSVKISRRVTVVISSPEYEADSTNETNIEFTELILKIFLSNPVFQENEPEQCFPHTDL